MRIHLLIAMMTTLIFGGMANTHAQISRTERLKALAPLYNIKLAPAPAPSTLGAAQVFGQPITPIAPTDACAAKAVTAEGVKAYTGVLYDFTTSIKFPEQGFLCAAKLKRCEGVGPEACPDINLLVRTGKDKRLAELMCSQLASAFGSNHRRVSVGVSATSELVGIRWESLEPVCKAEPSCECSRASVLPTITNVAPAQQCAAMQAAPDGTLGAYVGQVYLMGTSYALLGRSNTLCAATFKRCTVCPEVLTLVNESGAANVLCNTLSAAMGSEHRQLMAFVNMATNELVALQWAADKPSCEAPPKPSCPAAATAQPAQEGGDANEQAPLQLEIVPNGETTSK